MDPKNKLADFVTIWSISSLYILTCDQNNTVMNIILMNFQHKVIRLVSAFGGRWCVYIFVNSWNSCLLSWLAKALSKTISCFFPQLIHTSVAWSFNLFPLLCINTVELFISAMCQNKFNIIDYKPLEHSAKLLDSHMLPIVMILRFFNFKGCLI